VAEAEEQAARAPALPNALRLRLDATAVAASVLSEHKDVLAGFPGESEVLIELSTSIGERRLRLGPDYRVAHGPGLHAELDALLGDAILGAGSEPHSAAPTTPRSNGSEPDDLAAVGGELSSRASAQSIAVS
jgi:hypothetical protein